MAPGVDQERKEELILAKQLRQARVTILPKVKHIRLLANVSLSLQN